MTELTEQKEQLQAHLTKPSKSKAGLWFGLLILLLVLVLAGAGYFFLQQLRDKQAGLGSEINKEDQQLISLTGQITGYQQQIAAIQEQLASVNKKLSKKDDLHSDQIKEFSKLHGDRLDITKKELSKDIKSLQRQLGKTRSDWLVADAEYLLSVANLRLKLLGDIDTTVLALEAADERLLESGDSAAFKIREEIAKEINLLKRAPKIDIVGIFSKIRLIESEVSGLALFLPHAGLKLNLDVEKTVTPAVEGPKKDAIDTVLEGFKRLVKIRRADRNVDAVLTPQEVLFIQQQMKIKLELVKNALVQQDSKLYQAALDDSIDWLQESFKMDDEEGLNMKSELVKLKAIKIQSRQPDIGRSLKLIRDLNMLRLEKGQAVSKDNKS